MFLKPRQTRLPVRPVLPGSADRARRKRRRRTPRPSRATNRAWGGGARTTRRPRVEDAGGPALGDAVRGEGGTDLVPGLPGPVLPGLVAAVAEDDLPAGRQIGDQGGPRVLRRRERRGGSGGRAPPAGPHGHRRGHPAGGVATGRRRRPSRRFNAGDFLQDRRRARSARLRRFPRQYPPSAIRPAGAPPSPRNIHGALAFGQPETKNSGAQPSLGWGTGLKS